MLISYFWTYKSLKNDQATRLFFFWKLKWKENGVQTARCIVEGEVWGQKYKMQTIVYLRSQNIETWMVKPLSAGCVNTGCMLNTDRGEREGACTLLAMLTGLLYYWGEPERAPHG